MKTRLQSISAAAYLVCVVFFATSSATAQDSDFDGMSDVEEMIAGTDHFDAESIFKITIGCQKINGLDHVQLEWDAQVGRVYNVEWTPSLELNYTTLASGIIFPSNSFSRVLGAGLPAGYYRVVTQLKLYDADGDGLPNSFESEFFNSTTSAVTHLDQDGDGFDNLSEYISGTVPTNEADYFKVSTYPSTSGPEGNVIEWTSVPGRQYSVYCCTNLTEWFEPLITGIKFPTNTFVDTVHNDEECIFYQVRVSMQHNAPATIMELPVRMLNLDITKLQAGIPVINGGTETLEWRASTTTPWLEVVTANGSILPDSGTGWLTIKADPEGLIGQPQGTVTIVGGGISVDIDVKLSLDLELEAITIEGSSFAFEHVSNPYVCIGHYEGGGTTPVEASWSEDSGFSSINTIGLLSVEELEADEEAQVTAVFEGIEITKDIILKDNTGSAPFPLPDFPAAFGPYEVPYVAVGPPSSIPAIAEWSRSAKSGDTITLTGSRLSSLSGGAAGTDTGFLIFGQSGSVKVTDDVAIQSVTDMQAAITIPNTLPPNSMYMMWPENGGGYGSPVALNATQAWWVGPDLIAHEKSFSIYGNNLIADEDNPVSYVYIQSSNGSGFWLTSDSATPYKADFTLPIGTANGEYTIWAHNGMGQQLGWGRPIALEVDSLVWDGPVLDVTQSPYNAKGDGIADDSQAIITALDDCPQGGTIYFPPGTYMIGTSINNIHGYKRILGSGKDLTKLSTHSNFQSQDAFQGIIHATIKNSEIRDLTVDTGQYSRGAAVRVRGSKNVLFENVRFTSLDSSLSNLANADIVDLTQSQNMTFRNCDVYAHGTFFGGDASQIFIENCDFYGIYENNKLISLDGSHEVSITGTTGQNYDNSDYTDNYGWCQGRFIYGSGNGGAMWNWYIGENTTTDMCPRYNFDQPQYNGGQIDQNTGEQLMWEGLGTRHKQQVAAATLNTVTLAGLDRGLTDYRMVIVEGTGMGQSRQIVNTENEVLTIDQDWNVIPDTSSVVLIGTYGANFLIYGNNLDGTTRAHTPGDSNYTATAGVNMYGGFQNSIVTGNTVTEVRTGIFEFSLAENTVEENINTIQPVMFNTFLNNHITKTRIGIGSASLTFHDYANDPDLAIIGTVWRNNHIDDAYEFAIAVAQTEPEYRIETSVFDRNHASNSPIEVDVSGPASNLIFIDP